MKRFNWDEFVSNEDTPVLTRDGKDVEVIGYSKKMGNTPIIVVIDGYNSPVYRRKDGRFDVDSDENSDLFFKPNYQSINGIKCPLPFNPKKGEVYFIPSFSSNTGADKVISENDFYDKSIDRLVGCYRTADDAHEVREALLKGIGRE